MSGIDDIDFMESSPCNSSTFLHPAGSPGAPPLLLKSPTVHSGMNNAKRKHRRSLSEQIFSKATLHGNGPKSYIRDRLHRRNKSGKVRVTYKENWEESFGGGGGSLCGLETGWDFESPFDRSSNDGNFPPFQNPQNVTIKHSTSGRSHSEAHFKQALRRTVKKALSSSRAEDEEIAGYSSNDSSTGIWNLQNRHKRLSDERKRHQKRASYCSDHMDTASTLWICKLTIRHAKLIEKRNCCVHVKHMDKLVAKLGFSGETRTPMWNKKIHFPISSVDEPLENALLQLQIVEKHKVRSDKLIGRAYIYLHRDETVCSHEAPIKNFNLKKGHSQELGTIYVETFVEADFFVSNDDSTSLVPDKVATEIGTTSYVQKSQRYKRLSSMLTSRVRLPSFNRPTPSSRGSSTELLIHSDYEFYFSPYDVTLRYLETDIAKPFTKVPWRPFFDWPGQRCTEFPMMAFKRRYPAHFWELRIPKLSWPIEFLLPMARLELPTANIRDTLNMGDTMKVIKIVESGIVNIYLVGARGLRSIPQVEMVAKSGLDDWSRGIESNAGGLVLGSVSDGSPVCHSSAIASGVWGSTASPGDSSINIASPKTRAATLVALHWAAKSLTLQPSPQVEFTYGREKKSSNIVKNNGNPNFLEEFDFRVRNGSPRFIRITVYDRETRPGTSGIPRSSIMGDHSIILMKSHLQIQLYLTEEAMFRWGIRGGRTSVIDLNDMPLEVTQKMELQLLKNSNEARILMFVTITGLTTASRSLVQNGFQIDQHFPSISSASEIQLSHSFISDDDSRVFSGERGFENDDKSDLQNLPPTLLKQLSEHYVGLTLESFRNSFKNYHDVGWMRLKICSATGLGGKSINGRIEIFCVIDMFNTHLRTQSIIKRKNPTWNRCFVIPLSDIHAIMKITVVEVEKNKAEVIGGLAIHPLRVDNGGSKWYALKTPDLRGPTKGSILLEFNVVYNKFKSALKSFSPLEPRYRGIAVKQKSTLSMIQQLQQRFENLKPFLESIRWINQTLDDWWLWKNPIHSFLGLIGYQLVVFFFQPYFIPFFMILVLLNNRIFKRKKIEAFIHDSKHSKSPFRLASSFEHEIYKKQFELLNQHSSNSSLTSEQRLQNEEDDMESNKQLFTGPQVDIPCGKEEDEIPLAPTKPEGKKTVKTVRNAFKQKTRLFEILENSASTYERAEGLFNWRLPWLSSLFVIVLLLLTVTLYFVPVKFLFMLYGFHKFTKAILRPNALRHNELTNILSRVPDLIEAAELLEYRPDAFTIPLKGRLSRI